MKKQDNMSPPKVYKSLIIESKVTERAEMLGKKFKSILFKNDR
jgi:hypothetical protein